MIPLSRGLLMKRLRVAREQFPIVGLRMAGCLVLWLERSIPAAGTASPFVRQATAFCFAADSFISCSRKVYAFWFLALFSSIFWRSMSSRSFFTLASWTYSLRHNCRSAAWPSVSRACRSISPKNSKKSYRFLKKLMCVVLYLNKWKTNQY